MGTKQKNRENSLWSKCAYGFADIYGGGRFTYLMAVILLSQFVGTILFAPIVLMVAAILFTVVFPMKLSASRW